MSCSTWWVWASWVRAEEICWGDLFSRKGSGEARMPEGSERARPMRTVP